MLLSAARSTPQQEPCSIPCNLCGGAEVSTLATRGRKGKPLRTVICRHCGLVWSDPLPYDPRHFYQEDYRLAYKRTYQPEPKHILRAGQGSISRLSCIDHLLSEPRTILDVGTGGGEFAYLLQSLGHDVRGVEPNRGYAEYSIREYGLDVYVGFLQDLPLPPDTFDVATLWHVLEHTEDPHSVLAKLQALLKPQGVLVVEVPNVEATCQSPSNTFHEAHLFNFNPVSLRKLAERAGFVVEEERLSADGGNIMLFLRNPSSAAPVSGSWAIPGNAERIMESIRNHTLLRHYLSAHPYRRLRWRLFQARREGRDTAILGTGKQLLDQLYSQLRNSRATAEVPFKQGSPHG